MNLLAATGVSTALVKHCAFYLLEGATVHLIYTDHIFTEKSWSLRVFCAIQYLHAQFYV